MRLRLSSWETTGLLHVGDQDVVSPLLHRTPCSHKSRDEVGLPLKPGHGLKITEQFGRDFPSEGRSFVSFEAISLASVKLKREFYILVLKQTAPIRLQGQEGYCTLPSPLRSSIIFLTVL